VTSGTLVIWSLSHSDHGTRMPYLDGFVRSAGSGMNCQWHGHWRRLIKIPGGADCYYCINHMTCRHMHIIVLLYLLLFLIFYPQSCHLYTLLHFLIFTLHVVIHYSWTHILCIAYILFYVYLADIITVYAQRSSMVILHTAHLHVHFYHVTTIQYCLLYKNWILL